MSSRKLHSVLIVAVLAALLLAGCQAIRPLPAGAGGADALIEQRKAEALAQELNTFDLMIAQDWEGYDAVTDPNFYQIGSDGAYIERDAMLAGLMDEKLVVRAPDLGEMRVEMISPSAYMVTYPLVFNGSYDGQDFANPRTVASLWVLRDGKWQNLFLVDQIRTAEFEPAGN